MGAGLGSAGREDDRWLLGAVLILAACALCTWVFAIWFAAHRHSTRDFPARVTGSAVGVDGEHPYRVVVDDQPGAYSFRRPPGLDTGDEIVGRYDYAGQYVGWSAYGRFTFNEDPPSRGVFFLPFGAALCLTWATVYIARGERPG